MASGSTPGRPACVAPSTSLYFDPAGRIQACCINAWRPLGRAPGTSIEEAFTGTAGQRLRDAVAVGDMTLGCRLCDTHGQERSFARNYDHLVADRAWPKRLELALSNACNLRCVMCNGELSSAIRTASGRAPLPTVYGDDFFEELARGLGHVEEVVFLGGEPFLGAEQLRAMDVVANSDRPIRTHITTNATLATPRVIGLIERLRPHLAVSIDALDPELFSAIRLGAHLDTVLENVETFRAVVDRCGGSVSIAFCVMATNFRELPAVCRWADERGLAVTANRVESPSSMRIDLNEDLLVEAISLYREFVDTYVGPNRATVLGERDRLTEALDRLRSAPPSRPDDVAARPDAVILADDRHVVTSVELADDLSPLAPMSRLVGRPLHEVPFQLETIFGSRQRSDARLDPDGTEVHTMSFGSDDRPVTVAAHHPPMADGQATWLLYLVAPTDSVPVVLSSRSRP